MSYDDEKKRRCGWCAKGLRVCLRIHDDPSDTRHPVDKPTLACTAPTEAEYISELEEKIALIMHQNNQKGGNVCH